MPETSPIAVIPSLQTIVSELERGIRPSAPIEGIFGDTLKSRILQQTVMENGSLAAIVQKNIAPLRASIIYQRQKNQTLMVEPVSLQILPPDIHATMNRLLDVPVIVHSTTHTVLPPEQWQTEKQQAEWVTYFVNIADYSQGNIVAYEQISNIISPAADTDIHDVHLIDLLFFTTCYELNRQEVSRFDEQATLQLEPLAPRFRKETHRRYPRVIPLTPEERKLLAGSGSSSQEVRPPERQKPLDIIRTSESGVIEVPGHESIHWAAASINSPTHTNNDVYQAYEQTHGGRFVFTDGSGVGKHIRENMELFCQVAGDTSYRSVQDAFSAAAATLQQHQEAGNPGTGVGMVVDVLPPSEQAEYWRVPILWKGDVGILQYDPRNKFDDKYGSYQHEYWQANPPEHPRKPNPANLRLVNMLYNAAGIYHAEREKETTHTALVDIRGNANIIFEHLGDQTPPHTTEIALTSGQILLLVSDGTRPHNFIASDFKPSKRQNEREKEELARNESYNRIVHQVLFDVSHGRKTLEEGAMKIRDAARDAGDNDDITVLLVRIPDSEEETVDTNSAPTLPRN